MTTPARAVVEARAIIGPFWSSWDLDADLSENVFEDLVRIIDAALRTRERETWRAASEMARTYFEPCDEPADISARECGEQIAAALAARGEVS